MIEQNNDGGVQGPEHRVVVGRRGVEVVYVDMVQLAIEALV